MRLRTPKNRSLWIGLALLALWTAVIVPPAYAYNFDDTYVALSGAQVCPGFGLAERLVYCVKETVLAATNTFLVPFSNLMGATISTCILFAIVLWGLLMVTGKTTAPVRDLFVMMLKIGCVLLFTWNFAGLYEVLLDSMSYMLTAISSFLILSWLGVDCLTIIPGSEMMIWQQVDCTMEMLFGGIIYPVSSGDPSPGILGFLLAALFSGAVGIFFALMGFWLLIQFVYTIARAIYVYITAYMAFSLMVIISPIFIPMILFRVTRAYFEKWLRVTIGFILQPIFLFAYLGMLLLAMNYVVVSGPRALFPTVAGPLIYFSNFTFGELMYYGGVYGEKSQASYGFKIDYAALKQRLGLPDTTDTGVMGVIGEHTLMNSQGQPLNWEGLDIFNLMGARNLFKVDWPSTGLDWVSMGYLGNPALYLPCSAVGPPSPQCISQATTLYLVDVFLAFIMALVTGFIFFSLLAVLPFIGSGLTGEAFSTVSFGTGALAPPGSKAVGGTLGNIQKGLASRLGFGGGG